MTGEAVMVTGAAGDLGRAIAQRLADDGWDLILADRAGTEPTLTDMVTGCARRGVQVSSVHFDVTDTAAVQEAIDTCSDRTGALQGLVNNAGYQGQFAPIHRYPLHEVARVLAVNVTGMFHVLARVAAAMIADNRGGAIVNMASMAGVSGAPNMSAYSASKAAVIGLTKSAAKDLAPYSIRVNAVSPAFIGPGRMWDNQTASQADAGSQYYDTEPDIVAQQMINMIPLRRLGHPHEVADTVAYLLGPQSSYVTGINFEVAGGSA